jgi:hypothetical protein
MKRRPCPTLQALSSIMVVDIDVLHFSELFCTLLAVLSRIVFVELSCKMSQTPHRLLLRLVQV